MDPPAADDSAISYLQSFGLEPGFVWPLAWGLLLVSFAIIGLMAILLVRSVFHSSPATLEGADSEPAERPASGTSWILVGVGATAFVLFLSAVWTMATVAQIGRPPQKPAFTVELIGHQWWWEARYLSERPSENFTTANEIRIPVGETVAIRLVSRDVIHSFWVPALGGKTDLIPGQTNVTWLQADAPGVYRGQCAEYCGLQHAHMALTVVAQEPEAFEAWRSGQLEPAPEAATEYVQAGKTAFIQKCGICHTVRGTRAQGIVGPDLSHLMQRHTLAAGTLPNSIGNLAGWIADPQHVKPGNFMPQPEITAIELQRILAFLETLE